MAISFVNVGTIASGTSGNITPALPASIAAGDILVLVVGAADNVVVTLPAGYTKKVELNSSTNCRLTVAWARATGSDSNPLVTHAAGNSIWGVIGAYRGCKSAGDPFTDAQSQANAGTTTTITAPTITPLSGDFVIFAAACGEGGTNNGGTQSITAWSGANPTLTERADYNDLGNGANLCPGGFATGPSTGGATGSRTATLANTAQATANSVGALLALTQDAGGSSFPQSYMAPLTGLQLPGQPAVAPPIGPTYGPDPSSFDVVTPLPISQFLHPLSLVMATRLFPAPQPIIPPAGAQVFNQALTATVTTVASIANSVGKLLSATATTTASIAKQVGKPLTATVTSTATLVALKVKTLAMTATVTTTASIIKSVGKQLSATSTTTASIVKQVGKILSATVTSTATMLTIKAKNLVMTATVTTTATMVRQVGKPLSATVSSTASLVKSVGKKLSATSTSTATMVTIKAKNLVMTATATSVATISRSVGKLLTPTVTATATITKQVGKRLSATASSSASILATFVGVQVGPFAASLVIADLATQGISVNDQGQITVAIVDQSGATVTVTDAGSSQASIQDGSGASVTITDKSP